MLSVFPSFIRFLKNISLFSLCVFFLLKAYNHYASHAYTSSAGIFVLMYFVLITIIGYYILAKAFKKPAKEFVFYYLATLTLKFLAALAAILAYVLLYKKLSTGFAIVFLAVFLFFTIFELVFFLRWFKK